MVFSEVVYLYLVESVWEMTEGRMRSCSEMKKKIFRSDEVKGTEKPRCWLYLHSVEVMKNDFNPTGFFEVGRINRCIKGNNKKVRAYKTINTS